MEAVTPPEESQIAKTTDRNGYSMLTLPMERRGIARFGISLFLLCWLVGWGIGWVAVSREIIRGTKGPEVFLIVWLIAWTVGGAWAMWSLWRLVRPTVPETMTFAKPNLIYDSGIRPMPMYWGYWRGQKDYWKKMFEKRKRIEFSPHEIQTLKLRETGDGNRLTIDHGNDRIDIGTGMTEVEREWLFELIKTEYKF